MKSVELDGGSVKMINGDTLSIREEIERNSVDLLITDPPFGIGETSFESMYNRNSEFVIPGYNEVGIDDYEEFTMRWVSLASTILKPGGSFYILSGYTNLVHLLNVLRKNCDLEVINHLIWKFNFGVYTKNKYVSSHYHILYGVKKGAKPKFNTYSRYGKEDKTESGGSANYRDREDVWIINKEYNPEKEKTQNKLPTKLLEKMILYSSNPGNIVCDLFAGSFSTARVAHALGRRSVSVEISENVFDVFCNKFLADL